MDSNATQLTNDNVSIISQTTSHGTVVSVSTASEPCRQQAVNNNILVSTINDGMLTQLCLDLNKHVSDPTILVTQFKAARAALTNSAVNNGTCTYNAFTSTTTHHLHDLLFHAMQEIYTTVYDDIVGLYVQHSDEVYSNGVQNISHELSFDKVLQLRATSHAIVCTMQKTCVDCFLHVLFDSRANKTMMKRLALPLGLNPSLGPKPRVTGVTASVLLDQEVLIKDMILPQFSATTCILGPICAIIMDNVES
jgi:hypothetical protein